MVGRPIRPAALLSVASPHRLRFLRRFTPSAAGSAGVALELDSSSDMRDSPLAGLRPRLLEYESSRDSYELPFRESPASSPPNRRRFPSGMLFEPVMPWLRHDMLRAVIDGSWKLSGGESCDRKKFTLGAQANPL